MAMKRSWANPVQPRPERLGGQRQERPPLSQLLFLQRAAGNHAVAQMLQQSLSLQRHPQTLPEVTDAPTEAPNIDLGGLPTAADKADLKKEQKALLKERKDLRKTPPARRSETDRSRLQAIDERLRLIEHRLTLRLKGDATKDEEKTLQINGITGGAAAWFADMQTVKFLDQYATVHKLLAARLAIAEAALQDFPKPADGWVQEEHSSLRGPGQGLHAFGLAIDLNPSRNPWLINPEASRPLNERDRPEPIEQSENIRDVIGRALLLVLGDATGGDTFFTRPGGTDQDARVEASYDKLARASQALERYLTLDAADKRPELDRLVRALGAKDPQKRNADGWATAIAGDRTTLGDAGTAKKWSRPQTGFLHLDKRLVKAMTDSGGAGLTWLGDVTIALGRDIMHFDMRGLGPITKVWKGGSEVRLS
jgi:hypothetical protein